MTDHDALLAQLKGIAAHLRAAYPLLLGDADYLDAAIDAVRKAT